MVVHRHISTLPTEAMPSLWPAMNRQEQMLHYNQGLDRWEGGSRERFLWMDNATFLLYVNAYLEFHRMEPPTPGQVQEAIRYCARLAYWNGCERFYDRHVHVQRLHAQENEERIS